MRLREVGVKSCSMAVSGLIRVFFPKNYFHLGFGKVEVVETEYWSPRLQSSSHLICVLPNVLTFTWEIITGRRKEANYLFPSSNTVLQH